MQAKNLFLAVAFSSLAAAASEEPYVIDVHELLSFEMPPDAVVVTANGFEVNGYVTVRTPFADYALPGASISFGPSRIWFWPPPW